MIDTELFTQWLTAELDVRHWSQSELARRSGLSQSMISLLILGKNQPGIDTLQYLAVAFNMRKEDVFRTVGVLDPLPDQDDPALVALNYLIPRLSSQSRKQVLDYARYVDARQTPGQSAPVCAPDTRC